MVHTITSIDETLLNSRPASKPESPEEGSIAQAESTESYLNTLKSQEFDEDGDKSSPEDGIHNPIVPDEAEERGKEEDGKGTELDEYGNALPESKTYTEEEVNERINKAVRERFERMQRNNPERAQAIKQAEQGFEYDPESGEGWKQQLETFVESTVGKMYEKQIKAQQEALERQEQAEFEDKFNRGRAKFDDFVSIVEDKPITDAMVMASRAFSDPAAFFYAAAKSQPQELERIAKISDPYKQIAEMGKLEERMRKHKAASSAPRPVSYLRGDVSHKTVEKREPSIEDLMHASDRKRTDKWHQLRRRS